MNIYQHIATEMERMSKIQLRIANYMIDHKNSVSFYNVKKIAELASVSEASIIRFATFLGFSGYPELREEFQLATQQQLSVKERLQMSYQAYGQQEADVLDVIKDDIYNISTALENLDFDNFTKIAEEILKAKRVFVVAFRSAASLGSFFQYYLNFTLDHVTLISSLGDYIERLETLNSEDLCIALTFERYSKATYDIISYAKKKKCRTVSLTDSLLSPVISHSDYYILTQTKMPTYLDSFVAPLSIINALLTYIGRHKNTELEKRLQDYDNVWDNFDVFLK